MVVEDGTIEGEQFDKIMNMLQKSVDFMARFHTLIEDISDEKALEISREFCSDESRPIFDQLIMEQVVNDENLKFGICREFLHIAIEDHACVESFPVAFGLFARNKYLIVCEGNNIPMYTELTEYEGHPAIMIYAE